MLVEGDLRLRACKLKGACVLAKATSSPDAYTAVEAQKCTWKGVWAEAAAVIAQECAAVTLVECAFEQCKSAVLVSGIADLRAMCQQLCTQHR